MRRFVVIMLLSGCAPLLPQAPVERALLRDLERIVDTRDQTGWLIDDLDVQAVLPDAMASACQVPAEQRRNAIAWLDEAIAARGGPVERAFVARGRDLDEVEDLLVLTRTRLVLQRADGWVSDGKCPFWLSPDAAFSGVQSYNQKLVLALETGARFYGQLEGTKGGFGGGGTGRLLLGYGFTDLFTLLGGIEIGGAARFTNIRVGSRAQVPAVLIFAAAPLVARLHRLSDNLDVELAPVGYFNQLRGTFQVGGRVGVGVGFSRLIVRDILPGITFSLNYDHIPATADAPQVNQLGAGVRGAFSTTL